MNKREYKRYLKAKPSSFKELPFTPFYNHLDNNFGNGLYGGNIYTLSGEFAKTTLAIQIANFTAKSGFKTLYCSLDESAGELIDKCVSRYSYKLNSHNAAVALDIGEDNAKAIDKFFDEVKDNLVIVDTFSPKLEFLESLKSQLEEQRPKLVFIDSLDLLSARLDTNTSKVLVELNRIAKDENIPIVIVAERIDEILKHLSSVILELRQEKEIEGVKVMAVDMLKNRYGNTTSSYLAYKAPFNVFVSIDNPSFFSTKDDELARRVDNG